MAGKGDGLRKGANLKAFAKNYDKVDWGKKKRKRAKQSVLVPVWKPFKSGKAYVTHSPEVCAPRSCCVHNVSDHHMKDWPQHYRTDTGVTERICKHGVGHPDPDQPWPKDDHRWLHGCDGCCTQPMDAAAPHGAQEGH